MRPILFLLISILLPSTLFAQSNAIVVLPFGGIQTLPVLDLDAANKVKSLGSRRVVPLGEDVIISDLKILPDGSHLLANVSGRGFAISDKDGNYRYEFDIQKRVPFIRSASVATYFAPGEPALVAIADSSSQFVFLRDTSSDKIVWAKNMRQGDGQGEFVQIIVQPNNRISVAGNFSTLGLSMIETFSIEEGKSETIRFANVAIAAQPQKTILIPKLQQIREVMVLDDGSFLVTTRLTLFRIKAKGDIIWEISLGDLGGIGGEFSAARLLPSGLVAFTTYQPGEWNRPHANHRAHWLDPDTKKIVASSSVFASAPIRVEPLLGHGGTGKFGFEAGLSEIGKGDIKKIKATQLTITPTEIEIGDRFSYAGKLLNEDNFAVGLKSARVKASPGKCSDPGEYLDLGKVESVAIAPGASYVLSGMVKTTNEFLTGEWCAKLEIENVFGEKRVLDLETSFLISLRKSKTDSTIKQNTIPFKEGALDLGSGDMGADVGVLLDDVVLDQGCCATSSSSKPALFWIIVLMVGFMGIRKKRR